VVVREIGFQNPTEVALTEDDDVVETLPPHGSHEAFSIWIPPRRPRCGEDVLDAEALDATAELVAEMQSRSRIMNLGAVSSGKASTICWAVQAAGGESVTLKWRTRRRSWAKTKKT
jgi:hypothetical protein